MAKARVTVTATDNLAKGLGQSKKQLTGFEKYVDTLGKKLSKSFSIAALATATVAGFKAMENAAKRCVSEYSEAEKVSKRLEAVWENVGSVTGKTAKQMDDYAEALEKQTYFTSESIKEAALLLAATESLTQDGFDRALQASADLAAALGEDITGAAQTLSRAIQEPEAALSRLKSIGVSFTEVEKQQINELAAANKEYEAQDIILSKIEQKYKGVAKAINDTPAGKLDNIRDLLGDIREALGGALLDSITPALEALYGWLLKIQEWATKRQTGYTPQELAQLSSVDALNEVYLKGRISSVADYNTAAQGIPVINATWEKVKSTSAPGDKNYDNFMTYMTSLQEMIDEYVEGLNAAVSEVLSTGSIASEDIYEKMKQYQQIVPESADYVQKYITEWETSLSDAARKVNAKKVVSDLQDFISKNATSSITKQIEDINDKLEDAWNNYSIAVSKGLETEAAEILEIIDSLSLKKGNLQISAMNLGDSKEGSSQSSEINYVQSPTFADNLGKAIGDVFVGNGIGLGGQADAFGAGVIDTFLDKMGTAGDVAASLANNMSTMGSALGGLMTALQFVFDGIYQVIGPQLETLMTALITPLTEIGKIIGSLILPILQLLTPVLNAIAKVVIVVSSTFQYIGQLLQHWVATVLNWLAGLNIFGWYPFAGLSTYDPGSPGNFLDYVENNLNQYDASLAGTNSVGTNTAISSASYRGATSVTINIYAEGPIVGDGGMREFARMIKDEFDALDYYGVTA